MMVGNEAMMVGADQTQNILILDLLELWLIIKQKIVAPIQSINVGIEEVMC